MNQLDAYDEGKREGEKIARRLRKNPIRLMFEKTTELEIKVPERYRKHSKSYYKGASLILEFFQERLALN